MTKRKKFRCLLIVFCILVNAITIYAANEQIINSLSGQNIKEAVPSGTVSLSIADPLFANMLTNQTLFTVKNSKIKVTLRYADITQHLDAEDWELKIYYSITRTKIVGTTQTTLTAIPETLKINYNAGKASYKDEDVKLYEGFCKASIEITAIEYKVSNGLGGYVTTNTVPSIRNNDVFLDLELETDRFYSIGAINNNRPFVYAIAPVNNELPVAWSFVQGAESYDVEWELVDIGTNAFSAANPIDFRNATRINTTNQNYNIPLAFPRGILIYRVRGVAESPSDGSRIEGVWSYNDGFLDGNTSTTPTPSTIAYRLDYDGLQPDYNWQYLASYAEDGKRKEVINYFDGSLRSRQTTTIVNSDNNAIVAETKYDFEGRPAVQMLPTPITSTGIHFYDPFNSTFDKNDFDTDVHYDNATPSTVPSTSATGAYYSTNNTASGIDAYTPDAQGYPYKRTQFLRDGTDRVRSESGVGIDHAIGSGHETKYYYSQAPQNEIDMLFGNDVGNATHYQKNMVKDANGQVSISYHDQEGRTIATALSGTVLTNLLPIDFSPTLISTSTDLTLNNLPIDNGLVSQSSIAPTERTNYIFSYNLTSPPQICRPGCTPNPNPPPICEDCKYDLEIKITNNEDGSLVPISAGLNQPGITITIPASAGCSGTNPIICKGTNDEGVTAASSNFEVLLDPGSYTVLKTITLNQKSLDLYHDALVASYMPCYTYPAYVDAPCDDCSSLCTQTFTPVENGVTVYRDNNGELVDQAVALDLLANCIQLCNNPASVPTGMTECDMKLMALKADMSPDGQYFDNKNSANNFNPPSEEINAWLNAAFPHGISTIWFHDIFSPSINSWDDVRANWDPAWADILVTAHPEYCLYQFNCEREYCTIPQEVKPLDNSDNIKSSNSYDLDLSLHNNTHEYYNPTNLTTYPAYPLPGTFLPQQYVWVPATTQKQDPYFNASSYRSCSSENDLEILSCPVNNQRPSPVSMDESVPMNNLLQNFMDYSTTGTPSYMSLWYVLDDPENIHLLPLSNGLSSIPATVGGAPVYLPIHVVQFFQALHGDGTAAHLGALNSGSNKYDYFAKEYLGFKKLIQYQRYKTYNFQGTSLLDPNCNNLPLANDPANWSYTSSGFQIRYPDSKLFETYWANVCFDGTNINYEASIQTALNNLTTVSNADIATGYQGNCEAYADGWIEQILTACPGTYTRTALEDLRHYLILVCASDADPLHSFGGDGTRITGNPVMGPAGVSFDDFQSVIDHYISPGCTSHGIVYPPLPVLDAQTSCTCANYNNYVLDHNDISLPYTPPAINNDPALIAASINAFYELTNITSANVTTWGTECALAHPNLQTLINANIPSAFICGQTVVPTPPNVNACSCTNLNSFLTAIGTSDPGDIAAEINSQFNLTCVTSAIVSDWLTACSTGVSTSTTFDAMPASLKCTPTDLNKCTSAHFNTFLSAQCGLFNGVSGITSSDYSSHTSDIAAEINIQFILPVPVTATDVSNWLTAISANNFTSTTFDAMPASLRCTPPPTPCELANMQAENDYNYSQNIIQLAKAEAAAQKFIQDYKVHCLTSLAGHETFTETYGLNQYYYTLYYYDQAGNLIKTVPPAGVVLLDQNGIDAAQNYRKGISGIPYTVPAHKMVTKYWYNSMQQLIKQYTPDGGVSEFFYDYWGRLVLSQNAKQKANSVSGSYLICSYTKYDNIGRIYEVGELKKNTTLSNLSVLAKTILKDANQDMAVNLLTSWIDDAASLRSQITKTYYDEPLSDITKDYFGFAGQENLQNRVATVTYTETLSSSHPLAYDHATHYSYDIHGNVKTLIQDNAELEPPSTTPETEIHSFGLKYIDYDYDLISGNVKKVSYQDRLDAQGYPQFDRFYHQYIYDADNRLTQALTSRDNVIWEKEEKYFFYKHGPLARTEIGDKTVQGLDNIYTIQGWLKGVNSNTLDNSRDAGHDAKLGNNLNKWFGVDAAGFTLRYFSGDYVSKNPTVNTFETDPTTNTLLVGDAPSLYNGNISMMATSIMDIRPTAYYHQQVLAQITGYKYDQLNRIKQARSYNDIDATANQWTTPAAYEGRYQETFSYDMNGNIYQASRKNRGGITFDQFTYNYWNQAETTSYGNGSNVPSPTLTVSEGQLIPSPADASNKLAYVYDGDGSTATSDCASNVDVDNQNNPNYHYDEIGNLKSDAQEYIDEIKWNVYGKVSQIIKNKAYRTKDDCNGNTVELVLQDIEFKYDASGNRVEKIVKPHKSQADGLGLTDEKDWVSTYYVRDAQGNIMATYERKYVANSATDYNDIFTLNEFEMYGNRRIGIQKGDPTIDKKVRNFTTTGFDATTHTFVAIDYPVPIPPVTNNKENPQSYARTLGYKELEITNHLGNVITTIGDRRLTVESTINLGTLDHYTANILSTADYYSFGMQQSERTYSSGYRFGFNGKEKDNEIKGDGDSYDFGERIFDARIGKWLSSDPMQIDYPSISSYTFVNDNPILFVDPDGGVITLPPNISQASKDAILANFQSVFNQTTPGGSNPKTVFDLPDASYNLELYVNKDNEVTFVHPSSALQLIKDVENQMFGSSPKCYEIPNGVLEQYELAKKIIEAANNPVQFDRDPDAEVIDYNDGTSTFTFNDALYNFRSADNKRDPINRKRDEQAATDLYKLLLHEQRVAWVIRGRMRTTGKEQADRRTAAVKNRNNWENRGKKNHLAYKNTKKSTSHSRANAHKPVRKLRIGYTWRGHHYSLKFNFKKWWKGKTKVHF